MASDEILLRKFRDGDRAAGNELLARLRPDLVAICWATSGDRQLAEDAVQEASLRLVRGVDGHRDGMLVRPWALRIARNATIDLLRRRRPHGTLEEDPATEAPPDAPLLRREDERLVADLVGRLPPTLREAVVLRYARDLPNDVVAESLGISMEALWARLSRARKWLRERVDAHVRDDRH